MLRLALNVATTRLILANGEEGGAAGGPYHSDGLRPDGDEWRISSSASNRLRDPGHGEFSRHHQGAPPVSRKSARASTLDAICPRKQMAIDADALRRDHRRKGRRSAAGRELEEESSFFGSMDGASKFVRGDAIARDHHHGGEPVRRHHHRHYPPRHAAWRGGGRVHCGCPSVTVW